MEYDPYPIESSDDDYDDDDYGDDNSLRLDEVAGLMWKKPSTAAYMVWFRDAWLPFVPITPSTPAKPLRWYLERIRKAPKRWMMYLPESWTTKEELGLARDAVYAVQRLKGIDTKTRAVLREVRVALDGCYENGEWLENLMRKRHDDRMAHESVKAELNAFHAARRTFDV